MTKKITGIKILSAGVMLMGVVHDAATFTPLISGKLALLEDGAKNAFTYFSLMCGILLILGGAFVYVLSDKLTEHTFLRKPFNLALFALVLDGILAVSYMTHNPFAWIVFVLTIALQLLCAKP